MNNFFLHPPPTAVRKVLLCILGFLLVFLWCMSFHCWNLLCHEATLLADDADKSWRKSPTALSICSTCIKLLDRGFFTYCSVWENYRSHKSLDMLTLRVFLTIRLRVIVTYFKQYIKSSPGAYNPWTCIILKNWS